MNDKALDVLPASPTAEDLAQQYKQIPPEKRNFSPNLTRKLDALPATQTPAGETVATRVVSSERKFTDFNREDWGKYIEENKLKTITVGKDTTVFPFPDSKGNYIAIAEMGVIRLKDEVNGSLGRAFESRLKEIGTDDRLNALRRGREKIEKINGQLRIIILAGNKDFPITLKNPVELEPDNETISNTLAINKIESRRLLAESAKK